MGGYLLTSPDVWMERSKFVTITQKGAPVMAKELWPAQHAIRAADCKKSRPRSQEASRAVTAQPRSRQDSPEADGTAKKPAEQPSNEGATNKNKIKNKNKKADEHREG